MPKAFKHKLTGKKLAAILLSLALSFFLIALFIFASLPKHETFVDQATGRPRFDQIMPAGTLIGDGSVVEMPDAERSAYAVGYSLGSQSGVALVTWDADNGRYTTAANRLFAPRVSGSAAKPPRLSLEPLGDTLPTLIVVRAAVGERTEGTFFVRRDGPDLIFVEMTDSFGRTKPAFFLVGDIPSQDDGGPGLVTLGSSYLDLQDVNGDGGVEAMFSSRSIEMSESGGGWGTSVDVYSWSDGKFVYNKELSYILTKNSSIFPEPSRP